MSTDAQTPAEGTVDYAGAAAAVLGQVAAPGEAEAQAGTPEKTEQPAGDLVEVSVRGRKVKMTQEAAEAHAEFVRQTRERDGRLGGELQQLRERLARTEGAIAATTAGKPAKADELQPPPADLAIQDYAEYHRQMLAYNKASMELQKLELVEQYNQREEAKVSAARRNQEQTKWATDFFAGNPELGKPYLRPIVKDVYLEHSAEIDAINESDGAKAAHERLAELSHERLVAIKSEGKQLESTTKPPRLEGAGAPAGKRVETPAKEFTLSDWKRKKREQRAAK